MRGHIRVTKLKPGAKGHFVCGIQPRDRPTIRPRDRQELSRFARAQWNSENWIRLIAPQLIVAMGIGLFGLPAERAAIGTPMNAFAAAHASSTVIPGRRPVLLFCWRSGALQRYTNDTEPSGRKRGPKPVSVLSYTSRSVGTSPRASVARRSPSSLRQQRNTKTRAAPRRPL